MYVPLGSMRIKLPLPAEHEGGLGHWFVRKINSPNPSFQMRVMYCAEDPETRSKNIELLDTEAPEHRPWTSVHAAPDAPLLPRSRWSPTMAAPSRAVTP